VSLWALWDELECPYYIGCGTVGMGACWFRLSAVLHNNNNFINSSLANGALEPCLEQS